MLKIKSKKKLIILMLAIVLIVAMASVAYADSSNYSVAVVGYGSVIEYGTHIYSDESDTYYFDNNTSSVYTYESRAYDITDGVPLCSYLVMPPTDSRTKAISSANDYDGDLVRYQHYNVFSSYTNTASGRYGTD